MPKKYKKYEFCKNVKCFYHDDHLNKCLGMSCIKTAKEFHKWLKKNNFEIVKK